MARRYAKRTTRRPTRRYRKGGSLASKAYRLAKTANKKASSIEVKRFPRTVSAFNPSSSALVNNSLMNISYGTTQYDRIGKQIHLRGLAISGVMQKDPAATGTIVRMIVYFSKQGNATPANLFGTSSPLVYDFQNKASQTYDAYKIVYNKIFMLTANRPEIFFKKYLKLNRKVLYADTDNTYPIRNDLNIMWLCDEVTNVPEVQYKTISYFTDA